MRIYLHELRRNRDFALGEVARGIGVETHVLSRIERGKIPLTDDVCSKLATFLSVTENDVREGVPNAEEIARDEDKMIDSLAAMSAAGEDAKAHGFGVGHAGRGEFLCPICKRGQLHYSVAGLNGHIWGRCTTDGCVAWMQ